MRIHIAPISKLPLPAIVFYPESELKVALCDPIEATFGFDVCGYIGKFIYA